MKLPPVVSESMTKTLVAFTPKASATEPVAIASVIGGEEIVTDSAVAKLSGAAYAWRTAPLARAISRNTVASIIGLLFI
jgi:hypothetical protein